MAAVDGYPRQPVGYRTRRNAGLFSLPEFPTARSSATMRKQMGDYALQAREIGVNYNGS
jgi:hypothetical protein